MEDVPVTNDLPTVTRGDFGPILERLVKQGSIIVLPIPETDACVDVQRIMTRKSHARTMAIVAMLFDFHARVMQRAEMDAKVNDSLKRMLWETEWKRDWMTPGDDRQNLWSKLDKQLESHTSKDLCAEQERGVQMIQTNPVSMIEGAGGTGKTEIIVHAQVRTCAIRTYSR